MQKFIVKKNVYREIILHLHLLIFFIFLNYFLCILEHNNNIYKLRSRSNKNL